MTHETITCDALDERLADLLDGTLGAAESAALEAHAAACERCRSMLADLRAIARDAAALPALRPPRDLWDVIEARIDAPVVPLDAARAQRGARPAPRRLPAAWLAAAAAALVLMTAGVTYRLTDRHVRDQMTAAAPEPRGAGGDAAAPADAAPAQLAAAPDTASVDSAGIQAPVRVVRAESARATRPDAVRNASALPPALQMYDREIGRLRVVVAQRRGELDPKTIAVIDQNLQLIDKAIRESRAALARDPESGFLQQQLNGALGKKVELLRTAALLPARS